MRRASLIALTGAAALALSNAASAAAYSLDESGLLGPYSMSDSFDVASAAWDYGRIINDRA
jgi:hypothetical protein